MAELREAPKRAWIAFFVSHGKLTREIDRRMAAAGVVGIDVYDVLLTLEMAQENRLRMCDLAEAIILSRSGLTRLVDRLERDGLVRREAHPADRRALFAVITDRGLAERERAWPHYQQAIADLFGSHMTDEEAELIASVLWRTTNESPTGCGGA